MPPPVRFVVSRIGLDRPHPGSTFIVRNLRDAGMEVIYTGLWQTPAATVQAAVQEDVDVLGVSLLSAAHMTVMPEVLRLCREMGVSDMPVIVGGIIPEQDKEPLRQMGCSGVFNPGTSMASIVETLTGLANTRRATRARDTGVLDVSLATALAEGITSVVDGQRERVAHALAAGKSRGGLRIGVTGPPGVGKSTFIGKLARQLRARGKRVAVIAVDPSSPITGGSLL